MTVEEAYKQIGVPVGHHFKYYDDECVFHEGLGGEAVILLYDSMYNDWIMSRYSTMQVDYLMQHKEAVKPMEEHPEKWHCDAYMDTHEAWVTYIHAVDEMMKKV